MARRFTASSAADLITFTLTSQLAAIPTGAFTFGVLWRPQSSHRGGIVKLTQSGSIQVGCNPFDGAGHLFFSVNGSGDAGDYTADIGSYRQDWFTKASGTASLLHRKYRYATSSWASEANLGSVGAGGTANENMVVGLFSSGQWADLDIAAMAFYASQIATNDIVASDVDTDFNAWASLATPAGLWKYDQASAGDSIPDVSGNGATGTATGTTISSDPPGFSYGGEEIFGTLTAGLGALTATIAGTHVVPATLLASLGALSAQIVSLPESAHPPLVSASDVRTLVSLSDVRTEVT